MARLSIACSISIKKFLWFCLATSGYECPFLETFSFVCAVFPLHSLRKVCTKIHEVVSRILVEMTFTSTTVGNKKRRTQMILFVWPTSIGYSLGFHSGGNVEKYMITWLVSACDVYSRLGRVHKRQTTFTRLVQNRDWRESSSDTRACFPFSVPSPWSPWW